MEMRQRVQRSARIETNVTLKRWRNRNGAWKMPACLTSPSIMHHFKTPRTHRYRTRTNAKSKLAMILDRDHDLITTANPSDTAPYDDVVTVGLG